jgi:hypothetical protein
MSPKKFRGVKEPFSRGLATAFHPIPSFAPYSYSSFTSGDNNFIFIIPHTKVSKKSNDIAVTGRGGPYICLL